MAKQHSEEDIEKALNYLRLKHPAVASREEAIMVLDGMHAFAKDFVSFLKVDKKDKGN